MLPLFSLWRTLSSDERIGGATLNFFLLLAIQIYRRDYYSLPTHFCFALVGISLFFWSLNFFACVENDKKSLMDFFTRLKNNDAHCIRCAWDVCHQTEASRLRVIGVGQFFVSLLVLIFC